MPEPPSVTPPVRSRLHPRADVVTGTPAPLRVVTVDKPPYAKTAKITAVVLGVIGLVWLLYLLRRLVILVLVAALMAAALDRPVVWVQSKLHLKHRGSAVAIVSLLTLAIIVGAVLLIAIPIAGQASEFRASLPTQAERLKTLPLIGHWLRNVDLKGSTERFLKEFPDRFNSDAILGVTRTVATGVVLFVTTIVSTVFLLLKGPDLTEGAAGLILDPGRQRRARRLGADLLDAVGGYVRGNLFISFLAALVVVISLEAMRVPFVAVLALLMFVLDLLPLVGATLGGGVVTAAIFLLDTHPWKAITFAVIFIVYQQVESHTLYPVVMGRTVKIGAIGVFFVTLAGAALGGIVGALLAIPAGAAISIVLKDLFEQRRERALDDPAVTGDELDDLPPVPV